MGSISLASDFKEFLRLLSSEGVEYLLVGGYAVAAYGHPRATGDLDIWVATHDQNADRLVSVLRTFGFTVSELSPSLFTTPDRIIRMGTPPVRIEILTGVSGVSFADCWPRAMHVMLDGVNVHLIARDDLLTNKRAAGRAKDTADLEALDP